MPRNWSEAEIDAILEDYFEMLLLELEGLRYNKTEHRLTLMDTIDRTKGSIERKHMNISAVLDAHGMPYIYGYKPYINYQHALFEAVQERIKEDIVLRASLTGEAGAVREPAPEFRIDPEQLIDPVRFYEDSPLPQEVPDPKMPEDIKKIIRKLEPPAERDARNRILGKAGEEFVFELERQRLSMLGRQDLADDVRWVARDDGDGYGYDIQSFRGTGTINEASRKRWLEIKTTNGSKTTPFFITRNELIVSEENPEIFRVVRLYDFRRRKRAYCLEPPLEDRVRLSPAIYRAYP